MVFQEYLDAAFTAEEKSTELYRILLQSGNYTEATLLSEVKAIIDRNLDISKMMADDIRKFLSCFYVPIRNYVPASGTINVQILKSSGTVVFDTDKQVVSASGSIFRVMSSGMGQQGDFVSLAVEQSAQNTVSGTYDGFIAVSAPNIDIGSVTLALNGVSIPRTYSPSNGFVAFVYGETLYVKIMPGVDIPSPTVGKEYVLNYNTTDGLAGNTEENSFNSFLLQVNDVNMKPVEYQITNSAIVNGAYAPNLGEMRDLLRYWFFTRGTLVKTSDYRNWFRSQANVGDCLAWSDTDIALMGGALEVTGKMRICLLDSTGAAASTALKTLLNEDIQAVKDVCPLEYIEPTFAYHFYEVKYIGSDDDSVFTGDAQTYLQSLYDITLVRESNGSLFSSLDLGVINKVIASSTANPRGLDLVPFYYLSQDIADGTSSVTLAFPSKNNLRRGATKYTLKNLNPDGSVASIEYLTELLTSQSVASIVRSNGSAVGTHNYATNTISLTMVFADSKLEVFGEALSRSFIDTGSFNCARKLGGITFTKVQTTF